jgi:hypothetical protein
MKDIFLVENCPALGLFQMAMSSTLNMYAKGYRRRADINKEDDRYAFITFDDDESAFSIVKSSRCEVNGNGKIYNI